MNVLDINDFVTLIEKDILSSNDLPGSRQRLNALLEYVPSDDLDGLAIIHHLRYLVGLSYEIEGKPEEAVAAYLALVSDAPDSMFSWLALTRLAVSP